MKPEFQDCWISKSLRPVVFWAWVPQTPLWHPSRAHLRGPNFGAILRVGGLLKILHSGCVHAPTGPVEHLNLVVDGPRRKQEEGHDWHNQDFWQLKCFSILKMAKV